MKKACATPRTDISAKAPDFIGFTDSIDSLTGAQTPHTSYRVLPDLIHDAVIALDTVVAEAIETPRPETYYLRPGSRHTDYARRGIPNAC